MASLLTYRALRKSAAFQRWHQNCAPALLAAVVDRQSKQYSRLLPGKPVKIGCASGFWGDTAVAAPQLIYGAKLDFLVFDYLSEITMSLLTAAKNKSPDMGYAPDFVQVAISPFIRDIKNKGIRIISNAGGVNPLSCGAKIQEAASAAGVDIKVAVVTGDDLLPQSSELAKAGVKDMDSGREFPPNVHSMNAYLGAGPIARALSLGADVVITGRCADSALALAPLLYSFSNWSLDNFDLLAAGSLAGHLMECGAQATGGIFTDWYNIDDWDNIGFPVIECAEDGALVLYKPPHTGGLVSQGTVSEQLLYEIGDPVHYFLPDVVCDFSQVKIEEIPGYEGGAVYIKGARGQPPSDFYKVSATYGSGFRLTAVCVVVGPRAVEKAKKTANSILTRCRRIFKQLHLEDFTSVNVEVLGSEHLYGENARLRQLPREVVLWISAHHNQKRALEFFAREVAPAGTGMAPGLTGIVGGRPKVSPVLKLYSFLYPKKHFKIDIHMNGEHVEEYNRQESPTQVYPSWWELPQPETPPAMELPTGTFSFRLEDLAYTRSGDKGNTANIGVIARHPSYLPYIRQALTSQAVEEYFEHLFEQIKHSTRSKVRRYEVPGVQGFNFVLHNILGGGGIASLRSDPQGKALGQMLLDFEIHNVPNLLEEVASPR
ncbi:uncharacterized protein LOC135473588 [Liolophura sinensis]|uniref:uncharacterized protein LOC135473588 n=1 Tax=Liolophura sinensis TaxID=3198878 RepID=UPI003157FED0